MRAPRELQPKETPEVVREAAIVVMAKLPVAGRVKTRLARQLGEQAAARLAGAFLSDTLRRILTVHWGGVFLAGDVPEAELFRPWLSAGVRYFHQGGGDLGERLERSIEHALSNGVRGAVAIGADTPHLPIQHLLGACRAVARERVAIGRALDGGFYALGIPLRRSPLGAVLQHRVWGTPAVYQETVVRLGLASIPFEVLAPFWDIDEPNDLIQLAQHLDEWHAWDELPATSQELGAIGIHRRDRGEFDRARGRPETAEAHHESPPRAAGKEPGKSS